MQEESNFDVLFGFANCLAQKTWENHEMIVMNPDQIAVFDDIGDFLSKFHVSFAVCIPSTLIEVNLSRMIME